MTVSFSSFPAPKYGTAYLQWTVTGTSLRSENKKIWITIN